MNEIDQLLKRFEHYLQQPWARNIAGPERIWLVIYAPEYERKLRRALPRFELSAVATGHPWHHLDLTEQFGEWIAQHRYREAYFAEPELIEGSLKIFAEAIKGLLRAALATDPAAIVAVSGLGSVFGLASVSELMLTVADAIPGRLALFFPGTRNGANYRLLDARDGWNYLAVPITAELT